MGCKGCSEVSPPYTHTLRVEKPGTTTDAAGHVTDATWSEVGTIRARFVTKGGRESFVFKQTKAETTDVLYALSTTISRQLRKNTHWRIRDGSDIYEITYSDLINKTGREVIIEVKAQV